VSTQRIDEYVHMLWHCFCRECDHSSRVHRHVVTGITLMCIFFVVGSRYMGLSVFPMITGVTLIANILEYPLDKVNLKTLNPKP
jgi:hypothetical protein